jgi:hypothetical protein
MILPMAEEATQSDSEKLAYLRGHEDELGMQCDRTTLHWRRATRRTDRRVLQSKWVYSCETVQFSGRCSCFCQ